MSCACPTPVEDATEAPSDLELTTDSAAAERMMGETPPPITHAAGRTKEYTDTTYGLGNWLIKTLANMPDEDKVALAYLTIGYPLTIAIAYWGSNL